MYKSTPITKKAKIAGEYNSALKQADLVKGAGDAYRTTYKDKGSPGETITGRREKTRVYTYDDMRADGATEAEIEAAKKYNEEKYGTQNPTNEGLANNTTGTGEFETFTEQKPGTDDFIGDIQEYKKQKRRVLGDLETRNLNRTTKKTEKDLRRVKIKEAREDRKQAKADGTSRKDRRKAFKQSKRNAKQEEMANEKMAFQKRSDLNREAQSFGLGAGENYEVDVMKTKSDYTRDQLIADARNKKEANEAANLNEFKLTDVDTSAGDDFINKFSKGTSLFMKKSPMKKNYFKK